jgi:L-rhamnose isomerase/sugar isomerase
MLDIINKDLIKNQNSKHAKNLEKKFENLAEQLQSRGIEIEDIFQKLESFIIAIPSWGTGTGGTRFARFAGISEPRNIFEKLEDCSTINKLVRCCPIVSPHFPWDKVDDFSELREYADSLNLSFGSINSNTFQDQPNQLHSYKFGSLSNISKDIRDQAVQHNIDCINWGKILGSESLTVWVGDGSNFPGQQHLTNALERYLESSHQIYASLPDNWQMFIEHKMFEPAFYSTIIQDWGTSILCAMELGPKAKSLVDLGHHAPNVNIEMIVARLIQFKKLAGFHFNDSKYGDDDLDSGSINTFQQFLILNELVDAEYREAEDFNPAYMLDQSHNVTDPIESLMNSAIEVQRSYLKALLVDRAKLHEYQNTNDALMALNELKLAYNTDVTPILEMYRKRLGGAIDPISTYRSSNYRNKLESVRPVSSNSSSSGIV